MKRAFTLIEVNLAMLIMAGGILSLVGLYSFGFRESRQSREDVESAAVADAFISPLVMAISATNLKWSTFRNIDNIPAGSADRQGWAAYLDNNGRVTGTLDGRAQFDKAMQAYAKGDIKYSSPVVPSGLQCGLVVLHDKDSPIVRIGFRATRHKDQLMSMPLYYTEVRFQGTNE